MKISVITPSFNQAQFLPDNLRTVSSQKGVELEHIIVDPGSTDGSTELAKQALHAILINEPDRGQSHGITKGFEISTGDVVTWLNSDDMYPSDDTLLKVALAFEKHPEADVIYGGVNFVDESGKWIRTGFINKDGAFLLESFEYQVGIVQPGMFMRRNVFEKLGGPSEDYNYCMDYEYWVRIAAAGHKWVFLDETLAHHRWWPGMKTASGRADSLIEHFKVCSKYFGYIHHKWIDRLAEFYSSNRDGVIDFKLSKDSPAKNACIKRIVEKFVTQDMLAELENSKNKHQIETLRYLREHAPDFKRIMFKEEELQGVKYSHPVADAEKKIAWHIFDSQDDLGRKFKSYRVPGNFSRSFDPNWFYDQERLASERLTRLSLSRKETCVIVANGPTLNKSNLDLLKYADVIISNYAIISPKLREHATCLTIVNDLVASQASVDFNRLDIPIIVPFWLANSVNSSDSTVFLKATVEPTFCGDIGGVFSWRSTVSFLNMQLAFALGYENVVLIGFDHSYHQAPDWKEGLSIKQESEDSNHFDPRYFQGKTWQAADTSNMEKMYLLARDAYEAAGRKIVNATVGGKLEVFPRWDLAEALGVGSCASFTSSSGKPNQSHGVNLISMVPTNAAVSILAIKDTVTVNARRDALRNLPDAELEAAYASLLKQHPFAWPTYLPTSKVPLVDRVVGVERVVDIYQNGLDRIYRPKLRALREKYMGSKRCFLIGNGPSLNNTDLSCLRNEVTFAVNGFFLKTADLDWTPTFYCVEDRLVAEDRAPWINEFNGPIKLFPAYLGYVFEPDDNTIFYDHRPRKSFPKGFDFSLQADQVTYTGCTVTFSLMQLAAYLGFEEIYLIGVDASYSIPEDARQDDGYGIGVLDMKSDDTNHFHPDYFGKGFRWHDPQVHKMLEAYAEARRVVDETDQRIYNATIGGKLEVFERRSFQSLFPQARPAGEMARQHAEKLLAAEQVKAAQGAFPRLLILDMTAMGNGTATGEIKANLLQGWPDANLLQVASPGKDRLELVRRFAAGFVNAEQSASDLRAAIAAFDPEVILYRPLADHPHLHDFAMTVLGATDVPLVSWIMDDWPARLQAEDPARFAAVQADLLQVLARSALRLSISQAMSAAFAARYGMSFQAIANGVDPADWTAPRQHVDGPVLVRYAGGLAPDMNAESVQRVAHVVERMAQAGQDIRFEISTRPHWAARSGALFAGLRSTRLDTESRPFAAYADWLCAADVALIAYNFDAASMRYVRYSMANKLPECLASGAALLVHGPRGVATVDYLAGTAAAVLADQPTEAAIEAALTGLLAAEARSGLGRAARTLAFERHSLPVLAARLQQSIITAARPLADAAVSAPAQDAVVPRNEIHLFAGAEALSAEPLGPDAAREHLAGQGVSGVMLCPDPRLILAARIANGTGPLAALHDWQQDTAAHMALYRQNRSKLVLAEAGAAATAPDAVLAALAGRAADAGFAGAFPASLPAQDPGQPDPVWLALAGQLLRENPVAARLHSECQASALPLAEANPDAAPGTGTLAAITRYQAVLADLAANRAAFDLRAARLAEEVVAHAATAKTHAASVQSHETQLAAAAGDAASAVVLRAQLQQLRLTAEAFHADAATLRDAAAATQRDLQALHARIGVLSGEHADLSAALARKDALLSEAQLRLAETNAALLAKVARATRLETDLELRIEKVLRLETAIKQANKQTATANRERDAARSAGDEARRTLDQIYRSKSWLATAPMRTLRRMLTPGS